MSKYSEKDCIKFKQKGITLIALIITIIVMLILSGVVLELVIGENGLINTAKSAKKESNYSEAKESLELFLLDIKTQVIDEERRATVVTDCDKLIGKDNITENDIKYENDYALIKYKNYEFKVDEQLRIIDSKQDENGNNNNDNNGTTYETTANIFDYSQGARVTYVTNIYSNSGQLMNGGYTGVNTAVGNNTESFWLASNYWNVQGCLENDSSIGNISYLHNGELKAEKSATTLIGRNTDKQTIIIDPRAYYGDTQNYTFEIDDLYLASANSDGDVGRFSIYISSGDENVATDPNDSSWEYVTEGEITTVAKNEKVYTGNLKFKYIKLDISSRNCGYMELAAIKGFKKIGTDGGIQLLAKQEGKKINIIASDDNSGISEIQIKRPNGAVTSEKINFFKNYSTKVNATQNGTYAITAINKEGTSKEIKIAINGLGQDADIYEYEGNLFNYNQGTRVTYATNVYRSFRTSSKWRIYWI